MTEMHTLVTPSQTVKPEFNLQKRIDALARGECTEDEFLFEALDVGESEANSPWNVLSFIDQRYRRGQLPGPLFHSIKSRIARRALDDGRAEVTIELFPASPPASADMDARAESAAPPPAAIQIGRTLRNRYVLEGLLGRGGMADVFKASDRSGLLPAQSERRVAVKVLRERIDQRPELLDNLRREFDSTRKLSHPNIVKVYEMDRDDAFAFYTMELLDGEHLSDLLGRADRRPLPRAYAWAIIGAVGAALTHAHSRNVIHGDVSPRNVMITRSGEVRVLDFGSSAGKAAVAATPGYASCELLEGRHTDPRDDLYALACLAYDLLAGEHPFQGRRSTEARDLGMRPRRPPGVSLSRWRTIQRGLSWSREGRSIPIREWLAKLGLEPEPGRLPLMHEVNELTPSPPQAPAVKATAPLIAAFIGTAIVCTAVAWQSFHRLSAAAEIGAFDTVASSAGPPAEPMALPSNVGIPLVVVTPTAPSRQSGSSQSVRHHAAAAMLPATAHPVMKFTANHYAARPNAHFAEIHLRRSRTSKDANAFVWWTEESSAKAGIDFAPQDRTLHTFSEGRRLTTLFIRLIPNAGRTRRTSFNVCMDKPDSGSVPADFTCSAILLPATAG